MGRYGKQSFDRYLVAIVSELGRVEQDYPEWPDKAFDAAKIISQKASRLLSASDNHCHGNQRDNQQIVKEAVQTGAIVLRFLLNMRNEFSYAMQPVDEMEVCHYDEFD